MTPYRFTILAIASAAITFSSNFVYAGGYDTGERDWDFLFQSENAAFEAATRQITPQRTLKKITGTLGPSINVPEASAFSVSRFSLMSRFGDNVRCMASYREPWGGHADFGMKWVYAASAVEQHFSSKDYGITCAVGFEAGPGILSLVGGGSYQEISYELTQFYAPFNVMGQTKVSDDGFGWRVGFAYEIPQYAMRASFIYNSAIDYDMKGSVNRPLPALFGGYVGAVSGSLTMPQSAEFKIQSGIAPGWLAFGSLKWTDWSVADSMPLCANGTPICNSVTQVSGLTLEWQDTWTATLGAAYQFNEYFSVAGNLTWDQGATNGFTSQTDTWIAGLTGILTPNEHLELKVFGTMGWMDGGKLSTAVLPGGVPNPVGYSAEFGDDRVYSFGGAVTFKF